METVPESAACCVMWTGLITTGSNSGLGTGESFTVLGEGGRGKGRVQEYSLWGCVLVGEHIRVDDDDHMMALRSRSSHWTSTEANRRLILAPRNTELV